MFEFTNSVFMSADVTRYCGSEQERQYLASFCSMRHWSNSDPIRFRQEQLEEILGQFKGELSGPSPSPNTKSQIKMSNTAPADTIIQAINGSFLLLYIYRKHGLVSDSFLTIHVSTGRTCYYIRSFKLFPGKYVLWVYLINSSANVKYSLKICF